MAGRLSFERVRAIVIAIAASIPDHRRGRNTQYAMAAAGLSDSKVGNLRWGASCQLFTWPAWRSRPVLADSPPRLIEQIRVKQLSQVHR